MPRKRAEPSPPLPIKKVLPENQPHPPIPHQSLKARRPKQRNPLRSNSGLMRDPVKITCLMVLFAVSICVVAAQSRHSQRGGDMDGTILSVTAWRTDKKTEPIRPSDIFLYENGIEQRVKNFSYDPSPAKILLLVDNSKTIPIDIEKMKRAVMEFAYEIFDGDQLFVIGYDEKPEIVQEWTDDAKKLEASIANFRKRGNPNLYDALSG